MANTWEKSNLILAINLNSDLSYLITTVQHSIPKIVKVICENTSESKLDCFVRN